MSATSIKSELLRNNLILLAFVTVLFFLNFYTKTIFFGPSGTHQWRQSDCLSIAKNYYEEGMHFFEPKIHYQGPKGGHAVSEFPILNYSAAVLWKLFGEGEYLYRLLEYLIYLAGIFTLFNTIGRYYRSWLMSFFAVSLLLTSPLLTFYSLNFIADVPALSLSIICYCLLYRFYKEKRVKHFYWSLFFGALAVLMKASAIVPLGMLAFFTFVDAFNLNRVFKTEKLFAKKWLPFCLVIAVALIIVSWYRFALNYNDNYKNAVFLLSVLPLWDMQQHEIFYNLKFLFNNHFPAFLNKPMLFLFFVLVMYVITKFKELNSFLKYSFIFSAAYFLLYLIFFFQVFNVHDYYLSNLMIFPVITFISFVHIISKTNFMAANSKFIMLFVCSVTLVNSFHAAAVYRLRMIKDDKLIHWFPFVSQDEQNNVNWLFWFNEKSVEKVKDLTPALREHGIKREDMVLSIPDQSFDISLYFMDQKGLTVSYDHIEHDSTVVDQQLKRREIKYVVLSDTAVKRYKAYKRIEHRLEPFFFKNDVQVLRVK
jgi:hypothetical protein